MSESYVPLVIREFKRLQSLADGAMSQLTDERFFAVPSPGDNSVAVIVKHVGGNLISRWTEFLTSDGEKPGRDRDTEFRITADDSREQSDSCGFPDFLRIPVSPEEVVASEECEKDCGLEKSLTGDFGGRVLIEAGRVLLKR